MAIPSRSSGTLRIVRKPNRRAFSTRVGKPTILVLEIGHVDRARLEHRSTPDRPADQREREVSVALGDRTVMRDEHQPVAVDAEDRHVDRLA